MIHRRFILVSFVALMSFIFHGSSWATVAGLQSLKAAYPGLDVKMYNCKVCHTGAVGKKENLNLYGLALQKSKLPADAKKLTVEDLRAIETQDADNDGISNAEEIKQGTLPGDPASVPPTDLKTSIPSPSENKTISPTNEIPPAPETEGLTPTPAKENEKNSSSSAPKTLENLLVALGQRMIPDAAAAEEANPPKAEYVGIETCAACHDKQYREFQKSTHARIEIPGETKAQGCETCHGPGSLHVEAGGGRGVGGIINPSKDPSTCFSCHTDKKLEFRLPYHHPVLEGKMSCTDCHSPHGSDVRPWSATTLEDVNETCFKCHKEQRGPFVWEHEALREGCVTCHKVHGSIHDKMLIVRDSNLCLRCHTQVNFPTIGKSGHGGRLPSGSCFSAGCHTAPHGSNFDDHLRY